MTAFEYHPEDCNDIHIELFYCDSKSDDDVDESDFETYCRERYDEVWNTGNGRFVVKIRIHPADVDAMTHQLDKEELHGCLGLREWNAI